MFHWLLIFSRIQFRTNKSIHFYNGVVFNKKITELCFVFITSIQIIVAWLKVLVILNTMFYISYTTMMLITSIYNIKKHMYKYTQNMHLNQWFNYKINFLLIVFDISSTCFFRYIDCYGTICKTAPFVKWCTICHKIGTKY